MQLQNLTTEVRQLALKTGEFIRGEKDKIQSKNVELKSLNSLVTYVDKTAEKQLVDGLGKLLPEAGFIAEEGTSDKKGSRYNWVIDPLDGTTNFIHGVPCFCISIGLMDGNEVVLGVIYEINLAECFYAWKNGGAWLNEKPIKVSDASALKDSLLATGFPYYDYGMKSEYLGLLGELMEKSRGIRRLGSAATDLAYVACGRFEAFYEYGLNPWDVAAGVLIVKEAGGKISDFTENDDYIFGRSIIASNSKTHAELNTIIKAHFTK